MSAVASPARPSQPDRRALVLLFATIAVMAVDAWVLATVPYTAQLGRVVREMLFVVAWIAVGVVALWVGRARLARRILALSLVLGSNVVGSFGLVSDGLLPRILVTLTAILVPMQVAFVMHLAASYPSGILGERFARRLVVAAYVIGGIEGGWFALTHVSQFVCAVCARSLTLIVIIPESVDAPISAVFSVAWITVAAGVVSLLVRRYRRAGTRRRRLLRLPYLSMLVTAALYVALTVMAALQGARTPWVVSDVATIALQIVALFSIPLCFLIALLQERLAYRPVGDLVVKLASGDGGGLQHSLATALGDPQLALAFPVSDGFVDSEGRRVPSPVADEQTAVTTVGDPDSPLALIRHDRSLSDEPALLTAAGSAIRLALENARLHADVRAQLREVRESRARIVTATDAARARIERDLHDGAQQRLLAVGLALQLLRQNPADTTLLEAAESELASALAELRELAAGIHPAVLTDLGLVPALRTLADRLGARIRLEMGTPIRRCSADVEAAAYFSAAEAITNALKHAAPSTVQVRVEEQGDRIVLRVQDDGPGGVDIGGAGLVGVRDRLAAVDGTLGIRSRHDVGTEVRIEVPCG